MKHHPRQDNDVMLRGADGQERQVGEMARKGKDAVQREYEHAGGPIDQDQAKEAGRDVMRAKVDNTDTGEIIEEKRVSKAKKQANGNGREYQEAVSEEETDAKKRGLLDRMKGFRVCFVVSICICLHFRAYISFTDFELFPDISAVQDNLTDRLPQEQKDRVERGKRFLTEEYFPEERRDQFIFRGKKVSSITTLAKHSFIYAHRLS
jgi:hypothetical protein